MSVGRFLLRRFNGDEEFRLDSAFILPIREEGCIRLWFEAETDGVAVKSLPDTAELHAFPRAEVGVALKFLYANELVGRRFSVPSGYDHVAEEHVATIYYVEHEDLNSIEIQIMAQQGDQFQVR